MTETAAHIISKKSLIRNIIRNFIGQGAPIIVGFFCIPRLISLLGVERFGFLSLVWVIVGYLSIFDLGVGRALTKLVGAELGSGNRQKIPEIFWTGVWLLCVTGIITFLIVQLSIPWLSGFMFRTPSLLNQEAYTALSIMAISLPFVIVSTGMRGVLEAHQRFDLVNWIRIPMGVYTFLAPLLAARFISVELPVIVAVLAVGRFIFLCLAFWLCFRAIPGLRKVSRVKREYSKPLFAMGGWMTIANIIGPLMVYTDRFLIGRVISMAAVAYYATPYEVVTRLWIIPQALGGVLFPAFSTMLASNPHRAKKMFRIAVDGTFLVMLPLIMLIIAFAPEGLRFWLGADFAGHSIRVCQILAIGVFINSYGRVPFHFLQGAGRPDIPALIFLGEFPLYLLALWYMLKTWGIEGAAIAWVARILLDNAALFIGSAWVTSSLWPEMWRGVLMTILPCLLFGGIIWMDSIGSKIVITIAALLAGLKATFWVLGHVMPKQPSGSLSGN